MNSLSWSLYLPCNGLKMTVDGIQYKIICKTFAAKYPRKETLIDLSAEYFDTADGKTYFIDLVQSLESETVTKIFRNMEKFLVKHKKED